MENIKLIIYDLDGSLIDSSKAVCKVFNQTLNEICEPSCPEDKIRSMIGMDLKEMYRKVMPVSKHKHIDDCFNRYFEIFIKIAPGMSFLLEGVEETVAYYNSRGIRQCVATNKGAKQAEAILTHLKIIRYFNLILGAKDVSKLKPAPDMVYLCLSRLGVEKEEVVMVGDTTFDIDAGKAAGVHTIAVTTGTHSREILASANPDYIIDNLNELKKIIK